MPGPDGKPATEEQTEVLVKIMYSKDKGKSLGPYLIGFIIELLFCGVMIVQVIRYIAHAKGDRRLNQFFVASTVTLALGYTVYLIRFDMNLFVFQFGSYAQFADLKGLVPFIPLETVIAVLVQSFYAERAYRLLGKNKLFLAVFVILASAQVAANIATVVFAMTQMKGLFDAFRVTTYLYIWLSLQIAVDAYITACMTLALWKSKTGWSQTDRVITKLVAFTVETQLPSLVIAAMPLPYVIGMLAVLNARVSLRQDLGGTHFSSQKNSYPLSSSNRHQQGTVHITTETYSQTSASPYHLGVNRQAAGSDDWQEDFKALGLTRTESNKAEPLGTAYNSKTRLTDHV